MQTGNTATDPAPSNIDKIGSDLPGKVEKEVISLEEANRRGWQIIHEHDARLMAENKRFWVEKLRKFPQCGEPL